MLFRSATDVSELLGCFEQYNFFRHYKEVISQVEHYVDEYFSLSMDIHWREFIVNKKALFVKWFEFVVAKKYSKIRTSTFIEMSKSIWRQIRLTESAKTKKYLRWLAVIHNKIERNLTIELFFYFFRIFFQLIQIT